jgi:cyclic beta-1,2-glucan synthetase
VRDEESGELWGPTLCRSARTLVVSVPHGQGYSRFAHDSHGIALELVQFVPLDDPVKISRLTIDESLAARRRLTVTAYVEWVLGASRTTTAPTS